MESLEQRRLLTINSSFANNLLTVSTPDNDSIVISASGGLVHINGIAASPQVSAAAVQQIAVTGGAATPTIDLSAVQSSMFASLISTSLGFTSLPQSTVVVKGSQVVDSLTVNGTSGDDNISLNPGATAAGISIFSVETTNVFTFGGADTITVALPSTGGALSSRIAINGGAAAPDNDRVIIAGSSSADTILLSVENTWPTGISVFDIEAVTVDGANGADSLEFLTNNGGDETVAISSTQVICPWTALDYRGIEALTVNSSYGRDAFAVTLPESGTPLPSLTLIAHGSTSSEDSVDIVGTDNDDNLSIAGNAISANGSLVTLSGIESATLDGRLGNDVLTATNVTIPVTLLGDAGRDQIGLSQPGAVGITINAGADSDSITLENFLGATSLNVIGNPTSPSLDDRLDLSHNDLTGVGPLTVSNVGTVDLSHNSLTTLPTALSGAKSINLSHNLLTALTAPQSFNVESLDARYNRLSTVGTLSNFSKLATLYVYGNDPLLNLQPFAQQAIDIDLQPVGLERAATISPADWSVDAGMSAYGDAVEAAIPKIAKALHYSPLKIFEYVRNNFEYQPYAGIMKGPLGTLDSRAGNDWDQAGLLIELLKAAGVTNTRFNFGRVTVPTSTFRSLVGVTTADALEELLWRTGLHGTISGDGNSVTIDHAWAEVQLIVPGGALQWVRLDPSWKFHQSNELTNTAWSSLNVLSTVPFNVEDYLSLDRDELAYEYYEQKVVDALRLNPATRGLSNADLSREPPLIASRYSSLPGLPTDYTLAGSVNSYANYDSIDASYFHRVGIIVRNSSGNIVLHYGAPVPAPHTFTGYLRTMDFLFDPMYVSYSYSPVFDELQPRLRLGNALARTGIAIPGATGNVSYETLRWTVGMSSPLSLEQDQYVRTAAENQVFVVGVDAHQLSPGYVQALQAVAEHNALSVTSTSTPLGSIGTAESLASVIHDYFRQTRVGQEVINRVTNGLPIYNAVEVGAASSLTSFDLYPTHQMPIVPQQLRIDIKSGFLQSITRNQVGQDDTEAQKRNEIILYNASAQEHATIEELVNVKSVSTVRLLQYAKVNGQAIHVFAPGTSETTIRNTLQLSTSNENSIVGAVAGGKTVRVHTSPVTIGNWTGAGWVSSSVTGSLFAISDGILTAGGAATNVPRVFPTPLSNFGGGQVVAGDPVNVANGAVYEDVVDVQIPGVGLPIVFQRHYDSSNTEANVALQAGFGVGWTHSYSDYVDVSGLSRHNPPGHGNDRIVPGGQAVWVDSNGQRHVFTAGGFSADSSQPWTNSDGLRGQFREYLAGNPMGSLRVYEFVEASGLIRRFVQTNWEVEKQVRLYELLDADQGLNPASRTHVRMAYWNGDNYGRRLEWVWNVDHPESKMQILWTGSGSSARISQIRQVTNAGAPLRTWDYSYTNGRLTKVEAPEVPVEVGLPATTRPTIQYQYETGFAGTKVHGLLRQIIQPDGGVIEHTYHPNGRGFHVIDPHGFAQAFQFDLFRSQARFYDEKGRLTVYDYDDKGNLQLLVHPDRSREEFTWNTLGYPLSKTDPYGLTERHTYGAGVNAALGNIATTEVGFNLSTGWLPATVKEANAVGALVDVPLVTTYTYDTRPINLNQAAFSKVGSVTLPSAIPGSRVTTYSYNTRGNLLTQTETIKPGETRTTSHSYDNSYGRLLQTVDPRGAQFVTNYENYNPLGQPQQVSRWTETVGGTPVWAVEKLHYNAEGFLDWQEDANGFRTEFVIDDLGRRLKTIHPQPDTALAWNSNRPETISKYDAMGNVIELRQPVGGGTPDRVTKYSYDKRQRQILTTRPDGSIITSAYDGTGAMVSATDGLGQATSFTVDARDRAVVTTHDDGTRTFADYNARGARVLERDANGNQTALVYDDLGRLSQRTLPVADNLIGGSSQQTWLYAYDAVGNRTSETLGYIYQSSTIVDRKTTYSYDALNRLIKRVDPDPDLVLSSPQNDGPLVSPVWTYQYDKVGNLLSTQLRPANVPDTSPATQRSDATFDGLNRQRSESKFISTADGNAVWTYTYDKVGNRLSAADPLGAITDSTYDRWNRLVQQTDPDPDPANPNVKSPVRAFAYDLVGNLLVETLRESGDAAANHDRKTAFTYDALNRPLTVARYEKNGSSTVLATSSTEYDAAGNVVLEVDPLGRVTRHQYDSRNRRIQTTDALGGTSQATYDALGNALTRTDARGNLTQHVYDSMNRRVRTIDPDPDAGGPLRSPVATNVYNFAGDLVITYLATEAQPFARRTDYVYDQLHRLIETDEPVPAAGEARHVWKYSYDVAGNRLTMTDPANLVTSYSYDALNRRLTQVDPDPDGGSSGTSRTWGYKYDKHGNLIEERLDAPSQFLSRTQYVYDFLDRQTAEQRINVSTGAVYSASLTAYDVAGNVTLATDPEGRQTLFTYDGLDRPIDEQVLGPGSDLPRTTFTYDAAGNLLTSTIVMATVADNRTTNYAYDALNRLLRTADPLRKVTAYRYDAVGNRIAESNPLGHATSYVYDRLDRRTEVRDPLNHVTTTAYDEASNITQVTDSNGNVTTYQYDELDRLRKEIEGTIAGTHPTTTYTYDPRDHLDTVVDRRGWKRDLDYDAFGRLTTERWEDPAQPGTYLKTLTYSYAADDQYNTVSGGSGGGNLYYSYNDPLRRLSRIQFNNGLAFVTTDYGYNLADQVVGFDVINDSLTGGADHAYYQTRTYDAAGRLDILQQSGLTANENHQQVNFGWNAADQLTSVSRLIVAAPGQVPPPSGVAVEGFEFDLAGRLVKKNVLAHPFASMNFQYTFDAADRITSMTTAGTGLSTATSTYSYNNANELTAADHQAAGLVDESYTLDNAGNRSGGGRTYDPFNRLTFDGTFTFTYDLEGNLTTRSKTGEHVTYTWDHRNRLTKVDYRTAAGAPTTFKGIEYLYDAFDRRIFKKVDSDGTAGPAGFAFTGYAYDGDRVVLSHNGLGVLTHRYLQAEEVDYVLSDQTVGGVPKWTFADHEGTVRRVAEPAGPVIADFAYDAFGRPATGGATPSAVDFLFGYAGGIYDGETGHQYHQARYYDPATGRFLSEDPAAADPKKNLYRYADGDPVNNSDPNGLAARSLGSSNIWFGGSIFGTAGASSTVSNPFAGSSFPSNPFGAGVTRSPAAATANLGSSIPSGNPFGVNPAPGSLPQSFNFGTTASTIASGNPFASGGGAIDSFGMQLPVNPLAGTSSIVNTNFNRPAVPPPRFQGAVQAVVGTAQVIGGVVGGGASSWTGAGAVAGGAVALRGADNFQAGLRTLWTGEIERTALNQVVTYGTGSETAGAFADAGADIGTAFVGLAAPRPVSLAPARVTSSTRIAAPSPLLQSQSITVGLEARPIVSQFDTFAVPTRAGSGSSYWWAGRYSTPASQHGAYLASEGRVFPTHRNSGLSGGELRSEQEAFATMRLMANNPVEMVRGQAREAGLTVFGRNERIADRGAENAIQRALQAYERSSSQ